MPIVIEDGHPKIRRIQLGTEDKALLTSRVLAHEGTYVGIVVGVVQQACSSWTDVIAFLQSMGIEEIPMVPPSTVKSDLIRDSAIN